MKTKSLILIACLAASSAANAFTNPIVSGTLQDVRTMLNQHGIHHEVWTTSDSDVEKALLKAKRTLDLKIETNEDVSIEDVKVIAKAMIGKTDIYPLSDATIEKLEGDSRAIHKLANIYSKRRLPSTSTLAMKLIEDDVYREHAMLIHIDNSFRSSNYTEAFAMAQAGFILSGENSSSYFGKEFASRLDAASLKLNSGQVSSAYSKGKTLARNLKRN